jgi:hypothetical protein
MTISDDEREALDALQNYSIRYNGPGGPSFTLKHARTILALLDRSTLIRPEYVPDDVWDEAVYAERMAGKDPYLRAQAAYRVLYDYVTALPQPKRAPLEVWLVVFEDGTSVTCLSQEAAERYANLLAAKEGRIAHLKEVECPMTSDLREVIARLSKESARDIAEGYTDASVDLKELTKLLAAAERSLNMDRMLDSQYWAGAKAAWNASQSDDPQAAFASIQRAYTGEPT